MRFFQERQQIVEHIWLLIPGTFIALVALIEPVHVDLRCLLLTGPSFLSLFHSYLSFFFLCEAAPSSLTSFHSGKVLTELKVIACICPEY